MLGCYKRPAGFGEGWIDLLSRDEIFPRFGLLDICITVDVGS